MWCCANSRRCHKTSRVQWKTASGFWRLEFGDVVVQLVDKGDLAGICIQISPSAPDRPAGLWRHCWSGRGCVRPFWWWRPAFVHTGQELFLCLGQHIPGQGSIDQATLSGGEAADTNSQRWKNWKTYKMYENPPTFNESRGILGSIMRGYHASPKVRHRRSSTVRGYGFFRNHRHRGRLPCKYFATMI